MYFVSAYCGLVGSMGVYIKYRFIYIHIGLYEL